MKPSSAYRLQIAMNMLMIASLPLKNKYILMKNLLVTLTITSLLFTSCNAQKADLIVYNGKVYTVNEKFDTAEAFAVKDGRIIGVGSSARIRKQFKATAEVDVAGKSVYPGFIDAHAHFFGYGESLQTADLRGTSSWQEVTQRLSQFAKTHPEGWLIGCGGETHLGE
jgi:predicted amidohydrolase YtcJ